MRPVERNARLRRLRRTTRMELAIRAAIYGVLAAEVKVRLCGITERPTAVVGQKRGNRLVLGNQNLQIGFRVGWLDGKLFFVTHK